MLRLRRSVIAALILQLATNAAPSAALLLCMSPDGRASIEFAAPGTVRCADADCEPDATGADEHSCRDIPVLSAGQATVRSSSAGLAPPSVLPAGAPRVIAPALPVGIARPATHLTVPPETRALRSVILTL
jgi:hypothetical protein